MLKVLNVRLGFATNSSSTHSIILAGSAKGDGPYKDNCYGGDRFLQATSDEKTRYMAQSLYTYLCHALGKDISAAVVRDMFQNVSLSFDSGYVDHQSLINVPKDATNSYSTAFFAELAKALVNDTTAHILGGNDNSEMDKQGRPHPAWAWLGQIIDKDDVLVVRQDGEIWTVFNKQTGAKLRIRFSAFESPQQAPACKPSVPELVDLKITDCCNANCEFCYQGSARNGMHADWGWLQQALHACQRVGVFEVVLGGGEPILCPHFVNVLRKSHKLGITCSFTTNSVAWYHNDVIRNAVLEYCSSYAHSIQDVADIKCVRDLHNAMILLGTRSRDPKLVFQYILDLNDMQNFKKIVDRVGERNGTLLLLGYKQTGRAASKPAPFHNVEWLQHLLTLQAKDKLNCTVGIDTKLAQDYKDELTAAEIPPELYYVTEGSHSMYIDAVTKCYGKSSYEGALVPCDSYLTSAFDAFKTW